MTTESPTFAEATAGRPAIEVRGLVRRCGRTDAVNHLNLTASQVFILLGCAVLELVIGAVTALR